MEAEDLLPMKLFTGAAVFLVSTNIWAQTPKATPAPSSTLLSEFSTSQPSNTPTSLDGKEYAIGRDDLVEVTVFEVQELSGAARVSASGTIALNYIGVVEAAGKTPLQLGHDIEDILKAKDINDPHVTVFVREYASQPVSVLGAVRWPGIYQLKGQKLLLDMLAMAQGLSDTAGQTIQVVRRGTSGPQSTTEPSGQTPETQTVSIDRTALFENGDYRLNIPIYAGDIINVLSAGSIFAVGELQKPGEYPLPHGKPVSVMQAIALGGGLNSAAKKKESFIVRLHTDGTKEKIPINIAKILDGSEQDVSLKANDVLFVPSNRVKTGFTKALDSATAIVVGRMIYAGVP
jgi:polysaccharide biosynthesis/export protein